MIALNYLNVTAVGPTVCVLAAAAGASVHIADSRQTENLQKVTKSYQNLPNAAKSCQKLPQVANSFQKLTKIDKS